MSIGKFVIVGVGSISISTQIEQFFTPLQHNHNADSAIVA